MNSKVMVEPLKTGILDSKEIRENNKDREGIRAEERKEERNNREEKGKE